MTDQSTQGILSPLLQRVRVGVVRKHLQGRILDFGCGNGGLLPSVAEVDYYGYDCDPLVIRTAQDEHPGFRFSTELPAGELFDTIALIAVIEHLQEPVTTLVNLAKYLTGEGQILITTPNPLFNVLYGFGARIGVFSVSAHEEHQDLIDRKRMTEIAYQADYQVVGIHYFLFGANQLFILQKKHAN